MTEKRRPCLARQQADQMYCSRCGLLWGTNDPDPPDCRDLPLPKPKVKKPKRKARDAR